MAGEELCGIHAHELSLRPPPVKHSYNTLYPTLPARRQGALPLARVNGALAKDDRRFLLAAMRGAVGFWNHGGVGARVLIVDDSQSFLDAARLLLGRQGVRVVGVALTSAEALRRAAELRPEVILVDVMLGRESGLDLTRRLADQGGADAAAIILISTHSKADLAELAVGSRAAGFLPKSELSADAIGRIVTGGAPAGL